MKHLIKLTAALTIGLSLALSSCKKADSTANKPVDRTDYNALSKQIALSFYKSLNSGSRGFKASSTGGRRVNSTGPQCGDVVVTPTNSIQIGDTTRVVTGNTVFTYLCNGGVLNEYSLADTLRTQETGVGFESIYTTAQNYSTRAVDVSYLKSISNGKMSVGYFQRKVNNNGVTTDQLSWATHYTLVNVAVTQTVDGAVITGGQANFTSTVYHKDDVIDINGWSDEHIGYITFQGNDIIKVIFGNAQGFTGTYLVNIKTGAAIQL
ncbi:hypothetical protein [Mucilaginibacter antarcticus]|uniref:Lipoprotein n=1 Tax=Mucilaginibacter antarcticus TaxID=1855725 RepID=A0ABW5XQ95_9SPHI